MKILLTGAAGNIGTHVLNHLLQENHDVSAIDIVPLLSHALPLPPSASFTILDLCDYAALEAFMRSTGPYQGVVHLGAIPDPLHHDPRHVHNVNVTSSYNVLRTAADLGVRRIVQASSVNAVGLSYTPPEHCWLNAVPMDEETPYKDEDPYALSKHTCEIQAAAMCRLYPDLRISSLRFHMARSTYQDSWPDARIEDVFGWVSFASCASACLLSLTSEGWQGAEVFNIVASRICWEGGLGRESKKTLSAELKDPKGTKGLKPEQGLEVVKPGVKKVTALELLNKHWPGTEIKAGWWTEGNERRGFWDTRKAETLLGWKHEGDLSP